MNRYLIMLVLAIGSVYGINNWLDTKKEEIYQQAAIRCAMNPERLGCDKFNTAAGE